MCACICVCACARSIIRKDDDSRELLSDGNWTPTCCSLGSLLMNRSERGQQRRNGKQETMRPSCVMFRHRAKVSVSFTKTLGASPASVRIAFLAVFFSFFFVLLLAFFCKAFKRCLLRPSHFENVTRSSSQTSVILGLPDWLPTALFFIR